jgi:hypothetical protein
MKNQNSIKRSALLFFCAAFFVLCINATSARAQTVYLVCTWDTSSIYKQKDGKEKFERRFYVTDLIPITKDSFVGLTNGHRIEDSCGDYIEGTVYQAATERGEKLDSSGSLKVIRNIEDSGEDIGSANRWKFASKEEIEKKRADSIREMQGAGRVISTFNWDPTSNNQAADLAKERQRIPANMAVTTPPPASKTAPQPTSNSNPPANKSSAATNYIFGWARVLTTVQDLDRNDASINRAYYSNIIALPTNADASALKGQVSTYFNQMGVPYAMKVNEKAQVKDVMVKTFPTLVEADNARYAMATEDKDKLNANATREVTLPVSYFTWNYYGSRHDLFPDISEFVTTGYDSSWEFVVFETNVEKQVNGETVHETRYYVSYPYELFMSGTESIKQRNHLDAYFTKTVVEPAKQRGVKISYYDSDIHDWEVSYKTFAEAWAARAERVDVIKSNGYPQYDFLIISNGPNKGEGTSFPFCATGCTGDHARVTSLEVRPAPIKH